MKTIISLSLATLALTIGVAASQARPVHSSIAETRGRLAHTLTEGRYMRLDSGSMKGCPATLDGGENRFDRMYDSIEPSYCASQR